MRLIAFLLFSLSASLLMAQTSTNILNALETKYSKANLSASMAIEIEIPEAEKETVPALLQMKKNQYRFKIGHDEILSDGLDLYAYNAQLNEVQINDLTEDQGMFSPNTILNLHNSGAYEHALINTFPYKGKSCHLIEFKPTDDMSDIVKYKMFIDAEKDEIAEVSISMRDGARYVLLFESTDFKASFPTDMFTFKAASYPEAHIEDLRLD